MPKKNTLDSYLSDDRYLKPAIERMRMKEPLQASDKELAHFRYNHVGFLHLENAEISKPLLWQLYYFHTKRILSIYYVLDEIRYLEGITKATRTKKEEEFKGQYLRGLWHKHFYSDMFFYRNIINYWEMEKKINSKLDKMIDEIFQSSKSDYITEEIINLIVYRLTDDPFRNKILRGTCTGEWIVFAKINNKNYYLVLGQHNDDENICKLIKCYCLTEYPELKTVIEEKTA
ncbi:hypothetical protein BMS3Bbin05_00236 [bacterium BMS3Bbin05]|nr:hypothetical protein BMS3Bbin05_00236 [bacterium BMS3Bbin05]